MMLQEPTKSTVLLQHVLDTCPTQRQIVSCNMLVLGLTRCSHDEHRVLQLGQLLTAPTAQLRWLPKGEDLIS